MNSKLKIKFAAAAGISLCSICAAALIFALAAFAGAEETRKIPLIGYLSSSSAAAASFRTEPFRRGLRELGYVEGENISIEYRYAEGKNDRLSALAAELVRLNVDVIVSAGPVNTHAARQATNKIPIVMTQDPDPVGRRLVASLARPGGNITGLSSLTSEINGKRLELLKDSVPGLTRVAVFGGFTFEGSSRAASKEMESAALGLGLTLQQFTVKSLSDVEPAVRESKKSRAEAIFVQNFPPHIDRRIAELAIKTRLPAIYKDPAIVVGGGLMSYGVDLADLDRRAAVYVDKILKGAKPGELPVEQPTKFELVINLKTAKQIGLTIPPNVLARADKVIK
jgi:putative ABC transport system substrate-binding protein